ncbi:MAG: ABC transporter ATP-binding protein [Burkholderiaceae bacterium]
MNSTPPLEPTQPLLRCRDLCKQVTDSSGTLSILSRASFEVWAGQTVAIVGASGSGKSTLLSLLGGLDTPTSGQVWVGGESIVDMNEDQRAAWRARTLGFVFQSFQLLPHLSALENVMLPLELAGVPGAAEQARHMLERVQLGQRLRHLPRVLSGGEQQRVALARAFVVKPALLLADEPTGSLDAATGEAVLQLMLELNAELGTTLLLVTHDTALAARCQRRIEVHAGEVTEALSVA